MPSFKSILSGNDRWSVISYLRSFNKNYVQPVPGQGGAIATKEVKLRMSFDSQKRNITVVCNEMTKDNPSKPVEGAGIQLLVARYFGNMPVSDTRNTDKTGQVKFAVPANIPGDVNGIITLIAKINDETGELEALETNLKIAAGIPIHPVALNAQRAMWNTRDKSPVWLVLVFSLSLIIVWVVIFYIFVSLGKVRKIE